MKSHLSLLGAEGKALGRDFIVRLIKSGVKPTISGDLWSDGGMGLFGIYAHGISESWVMEKALIGQTAECKFCTTLVYMYVCTVTYYLRPVKHFKFF